jgi:hypothetical protein
VSEKQNILAISRYFKGERFLRQAHKRGANVYLLTAGRLLNEPWPRDALADIFGVGDEATQQDIINTVCYLARGIRFDHIVGLDDFDVEVAASLREHTRIGGMGDTTARHFRDKLAMRQKARDSAISVPDFVPVLNYDALREFMARVPTPWMLKPRSEASATGITKLEDSEQLWRLLDKLGDKQSSYLLEQYLPGDVYHVDALTEGKKVLFAEAHRCGKPPFNVAHGGGIFTTATVPRGSEDEKALLALNEKVLTSFGLVRGASHTEFIKGRQDGKFYLLETAARVGGAHIAEVCEAASGINLWEEWANIEVTRGKEPYSLPARRQEYGGVLLTLARQERPDLSGYNDPEVFYRAPEKNHAGLVVRSPSHARVLELLESYQARFMNDFFASMPAAEKPSH